METSDDDRRLAEIEAVLRTVPYHPDGNRLYLDDDDVKVIDGIRQIGLELLAMARAAEAWVPVAERLPEPGVGVLTAWRDGTVKEAWYATTGGWWTGGGHRPLKPTTVTHWRPMPAAPSPG